MTIKITDNVNIGGAKITTTNSTFTANDLITKGYADSIITSGGLKVVTKNFDCSGNPAYPASSAGEAHRVSVAGKVGGVAGAVVNVGDLIYCLTTSVAGDHATVGSSFEIMEHNIENATDTNTGVVKLADAAEITAGTSTSATPTVAGVVQLISNNSGGDTKTFKLTLGSTSYPIAHAMNAPVSPSCYEKVSGDYVTPGFHKTDLNTLTVTFTPATTVDYIVTLVKSKPEPA